MSLRYSGPAANYPVYTCRADRGHDGGPLCQEIRALPVDARIERILLEALTSDRIAIAVAALGEIEEETRQLERQWALRRERPSLRYGPTGDKPCALAPPEGVGTKVRPNTIDGLRRVEQRAGEGRSADCLHFKFVVTILYEHTVPMEPGQSRRKSAQAWSEL